LGNAAGLGATTVTTAITIISADATVDLNGLTSAEPFTISGSLVNTSGTAATSSGAITLSNAAIFGGTGNVTVSGIISSTGSLTKIGTGTFTLSGVNTFTGGVTINAGTLSVATIGNGNIAGNLGQATNAAANLVLGGGQLTYTGATATTDRNITLTASTVSQINISTSGTTLTVSGATANTTGGFTKEGLGTLTFSGTNLHTGVTYKNAGTLNNGRGLTTVSAGQTMYVAVGQTITIPSGSTLTNNGTVQVEGTLTITGTFVNTGTISGTGTYIFNSTTAQTIPAALTYPTLTISNTAGVTLAGNVTTSGQLTLNASNTLQISGYNLSVNSLTGSGNISNSGSCALITVSGTTNTTYSGIISGCTGLTKSGSSTLTMSGTNTFTGATTIAGGVLSVATIGNGGVSGNMGAATNVASNLVLSGGTLSYTGATTTTDRNFTLYTGTSSTIEVTTGANTLTLNGVLSSSGGIAKTGAGTLTLTGTNTYTGATTINAGTLSVATIGNGGVSGNMGAATNASANLVLGGGTLLYTGATASTDRNFILTNGTTSTINISANTFTWNGASTSTSGAITKAGAGTLIWNGANAYTGLTTISAGIVQLGNTTALGTAAAGVSITSGAALDLNGLNISNAEATTINGTGVASSGVIYNSSTTPATYAGLLTLGSASTIIGGAASINFTNKGTITGAFGLTIRGDAGGTLAGILGISSGTLTKADAGTWLVSGANTYTGATTISAGVLKLGSASALGTTSGSTTLTSGAALDLNGQTYTTAEGLTINGTGISNGGAIMNTSTTTATYAGTLRLGSASSIVGETGAINFTSTGAITGAFALTLNGSLGGSLTSPLTTSTGTLTKEGIGTWKLGGASTYTGATTINNGVLKLGKSSTANNGPLGTSAGSTTINSGATLDFNGYSLSSSSVEPLIPFGNGYNGLGAIINSSSTASTFQGTINTTNGADFKIGGVGQITFSGVIAGNKNITKIGTNTVLFSATNNSYSGTTTISEGYLSVESIANEGVTTGRLGNSSAIFIDGGGLIYSGATATTNRVITLNASKNSTISVSTTASILTLSGVMTGGGSLIKAGTGTLELTAQNTYSGSTTIAAGTLKVANITDAGNGYNLGTGSDIIFSGGTLLYNGSTASTNRNFTLTTSTISTINVSTAGSILTMSGTGSGAGALKIANNATGTLELTGSNSYSGATTISTGILKINTIANGGVNSSIGAASNSAANLIFGTGTLLYTGSSASTDRNFTLGASKTTTFDIENSASTLTIAGSCGSTSGGVTKIGAGTLALTGTNKYTGVTTITAGTLSVSTLNNGGVAGGMGAATNAVGKLVFNGGTLAYTGNSASTNRSFTIGSDLQATIKVVNASTNLIWTGISNASTGGITKTGAGTLTLTGLNTYTGTSYINEGTVKLGAVKTNLKASSASTNINAGPLGTGGSSGELTMASGTVVAAGATLDYNGFSIGTIGYVYNSSSRPYPTYTGYRYYENITISGNGVGNVGAIINSSSKSITTNYTRTYLAADASIGGTGNYPLTYYSGTSTLTKKGNNTVTFNSVSTVTGNIIVEAGTLKYGASGNVLGGTGGSTTINSGATLDLNGYSSSIVEPLILNGTGYNGVGALYNSSTAASSIACTITLNTDVSIGGKGNITQSGTISGSGNLTKINANTLTLSATTTNTYTGTTTISGGNLSVTNFANLGNSDNSASNLVLNGGWLTYSGTTATMARSFTVADGTANTFNTIAASTNIITLTGSSTGGGSLTKAGTATLLVQGLLNHSGGTKDSTGVLELASSNGDALNNNGSFVFGGGTLKSKAGGDNETAGAINLTNSSTVTFGSTTVAHNLNFANSIANTFKDGKLISITNWVKSSRNGDSSFNSGAAGRFFVGDDKYGLTPQQRAKIRFTINTNITSIKYLTFPGVYSSGTTLKKFYSLSAEHLSTGELVPAVPRPILDIQGTDGYDTTCVSQTKTYNYTIYNIGDIDAANVTVRSDNANFVIGTKTGSTTVTAITTLIDGTSSTPGSSITFPVVFTPGSVSGTQTVKLITSSSTSRTDNDTLILEVFVATPPSFTSSTSGGACYDDQFATLNATGSSGSYISWHTGPTPTLGDTLSFGNTYIIDPLTATTTYYAQANLGSCVTTTGRTALTAILNIPSSDATIASSVTSICSNGTTNLSVTVNGGVSPYTLIYNDGTNDIMVPNYVSGTLIPVTVSRSTTFSITSLTDALGCDCEDISTNGSVSVDVNASVGGTPFADVASFCPGGATILTLYDYDGDTFQWQQSADGITNWSTVSGGTNATTDTYSTATLNTTTYFRAAVTNLSCPVDYSDVLPVIVNASVGGTINSSSICTSTNTTLTLNGYTGNSLLWQQSDDGTNFEQVSGGSGSTTASFTTPNLYTTRYYQVVVTNGSCISASSSIATVTVNPVSIAGTIDGTTTLCATANSNTLTLSNYVGTIQWQSSTSISGTYTDITGETNATLLITNQTVSTYYRAVVTSGSCSAAITDNFLVTVTPTSVAGTISGATIVCASNNSTVLTLAGYTGAIQWQSSTDGSTFADIVGQTAATYTASNLTQPTYYQVNVTSGSCSMATTVPVMMDVTTSFAPYSITGTSTICVGNSTTLTTIAGCSDANSTFLWYAGGMGGDAYHQGFDAASAQFVATKSITFNNYNNGILNLTTSNTQGDPQIMMSSLGSFDPSVYKYINIRYRVTSGTADNAQIFFLNSANSNTATGGYSATGSLISDNTWRTVSIDMSSNANWTTGGNITGWRFDPAASATSCVGCSVTMDVDFIQLGTGAIVGTGSTLTVSPTSSTTYYVNRNGANISTDYIPQLVTVNALPTPTFTTQPGATACANTDVIYITEAGKSNYVWTLPGTAGIDYSITSGGTSIDNTLTVQWKTAGSKTVTINYTSGCAAPSATSSTATTVSATSVGGTATATAATVCTGTGTTITLTGYTGTIQWQQSADGTTWADVTGGSGGTTATYTTPNLTAVTYYQAVVTSGVCSEDISTMATVSINELPTTANAGADQTGAATCGLTTVTLDGNAPTVGTGTWSIVSGTGGTITTPTSRTSTFAGTAGTSYTLRWTISNSPCTASTDDVVITFNQNPTTANAGADQTGSSTCGLTIVTLAGNNPSVGTGAWSIVSGTGGTITTPSSRTSTFSGTAGSTYTLRWTISNSPCTATTDDVEITFNPAPTTANAGADQTGTPTCGLTTVTLAGNNPTVGTGAWSIVSGTGGTITTPSDRTSTFSGTAGSTYTLRWTITNNPCTASTDDVVITFNQPPTAGITNNTGTTVVTCTTPNISLTATGGTSYSWSDGTNVVGTSATLPVGSAATYTVTVTGSNGCTANSAINITENTTAPTAGITNNTATTVLTCATTSISLTATGGGNYSWSDGSTVVSSVAALSVTTPGTYTVTVTSSNGCTATSAVTITTDGSAVVPGITNNTGVTELTCTTASISLTATGGVSYSWTKSSTVVGTNATLSVTTPGTYIVTVTNSIGCSATSTITITRNITAPTAGITNNTATTVLNCTTTSISLTATGGGTYSWSNGSSVVGTSAALSVTSPATYTVTVTSSNGCTATSAVTITQNTAASTAAVLSGTATIPRGNSTNLSVAITGGTAPYTVVYTDGTSNFNVNSYTSGSNISVSPSTSTTYSLVSVTGANGCAGTGNSGTPVVTVNVGPTASVISGTTAICVGSSTNISVAITSGTSPYTVVYYNGTSNTTVNNYVSGTNISVSPTANTTYTIVSVTDANSNVGSGNNGSAVITVNTLPSITGTLTVCANATTQLSGSGTSASSNPWVSASTSIATIDNNGLVTGRALGTSIITYTNSNGCSKTAIITVSTPIAGIRNNTSTTVLTSTVTSISLTATGGSTYSWSDGSSVVSTTAAYRVTAPGTYTVTVTNANGCSSTASITITQTSTPPVSSITNNTGTTELNCTTSSISLTATGGGIYSWSNGTSVVGTSAGLTVTAPGTYTVTVTNGGSTSTSSITITQNVVTSATAVLTGSTTITSGKSANLQAAISIGNAPYTVVISDGISQFTTYSYYSGPNIVVTPSATKTYTLVTVIGANGCVVTSLSGSATVTINGGGTSKVWTGAAGDDLWSTDGNWSPAGTPASNDFITIPLGTPQLDVYFTVTGSLTVNGTGTLTVNAEKSIDIGAEGVVNFGKRDITFKSSATGTAQLGKIEGTLSNADSVIVERYFPAGRRAYRFISASVTTPSSIRYNWMENATPVFTYTTIYNTLSQYNPKLGYGTHITGLGANASGFDRTQLNTSTIYTLNTTTQAWVALGSTAGTLAAGDAYRILIRGDRSTNLNNNNATAAATTIRTKGAPKVGLHTVSSSLSTTADGWSLVGNPYQALVDLRGVSTNNLTPYYSIWDPQRGTRGAYVSYHLGTGIKSNVASDVNELVQPGQAFFVQTLNNGAATLTFDESNKAPLGTHTRVFRPMVSYPVLNVALIYTDSLANGAPEMDAFAVVFDNNFSNSVDKEDGQKNYNQDDNMGISRDGKLLAMELRDMYNATTVIPMNMVNYVRQNYTLRMNWSNPIDAGYEAYLKDNYTGATQTISFSSNTDYVFMVNSSIAASKATDRFSILFLPSSALPVSGLELNGTAERKQVKLQFEAINEKEMIGYAIERSADGIRFEQIGDQPAVNVTTGANRLYGYTDKQPVIGNNYYRIKGTSLDGQVQYSNTKLIKFGNTMPTVTVAPNPAGNDKIKLKVAQLLKGSYTLTVTDALGRVFCQKELVYDGVSGMMELKFPSIAKSGSYYVKIDGEGGSFTEAFIIQ
jgi:autotransporter-associated beta strand protein